MVNDKQFITVTDENHALFRQKLIVTATPQGSESHLSVQLPNGEQTQISKNCTDYEQLLNQESSFEQKHLLDFEGLLKVVKLLEVWQSEKSYTDQP